MKKILMIILALVAGLSYGAEIIPGDIEQDYIEYVFDTPTTREDGSALPPEEIKGYKIYQYYNGALEQTFDVPGSPFLAPINKKGAYTATISTIDSDGNEGKPSGPISFFVTDEPVNFPLPPANGTLNVNQKCSIDCQYQIINGQ